MVKLSSFGAGFSRRYWNLKLNDVRPNFLSDTCLHISSNITFRHKSPSRN